MALIERTSNNQADPAKFRNDLLNIARTTLSSKILTQVRRLLVFPVHKFARVVSSHLAHHRWVAAVQYLQLPSPRVFPLLRG